MKVRRFSSVITSPALWANYPRLRVERRDESRPGMPRAFIFANDIGEVIPTVYFFRNRMHNSDPIRENAFKQIDYSDVDDVIDAGWRPHSGEELDVPFG